MANGLSSVSATNSAQSTCSTAEQDSSEQRSSVGNFMGRKVRWCCKIPEELIRQIFNFAAKLDLIKIRIEKSLGFSTKNIEFANCNDRKFVTLSNKNLFQEILKSDEVNEAYGQMTGGLEKYNEAYRHEKNVKLRRDFGTLSNRFTRKFESFEHLVKMIIAIDFYYSEQLRRIKSVDTSGHTPTSLDKAIKAHLKETLNEAGKAHLKETLKDYSNFNATKKWWIFVNIQSNANKLVSLAGLKELMFNYMSVDNRKRFDSGEYFALLLMHRDNEFAFKAIAKIMDGRPIIPREAEEVDAADKQPDTPKKESNSEDQKSKAGLTEGSASSKRYEEADKDYLNGLDQLWTNVSELRADMKTALKELNDSRLQPIPEESIKSDTSLTDYNGSEPPLEESRRDQ